MTIAHQISSCSQVEPEHLLPYISKISSLISAHIKRSTLPFEQEEEESQGWRKGGDAGYPSPREVTSEVVKARFYPGVHFLPPFKEGDPIFMPTLNTTGKTKSATLGMLGCFCFIFDPGSSYLDQAGPPRSPVPGCRSVYCDNTKLTTVLEIA